VYATAWIYDPASGQFTQTDNAMSAPRAGHTATLLPDNTVLIAGGIGDNNVTHSSAEIYDLASRRFTPTSPMSQARRNHAANLLPGGRVLVAGGGDGIGDDSRTLASSELYDPGTRTFHPAGDMLQARESQAATLLPDGMVLMAGGLVPKDNQVLRTAELYDPATGDFSQTGSTEYPHSGITGAVFVTGEVLITGSSDPPVAEFYNPGAGAFAPAANVNVNRAGHTATRIGGGVLVCGGVAGGETLSGAELFR
jgi:hypothetical protein